ncbi:hypothetical protein [Mangrovivirga cuniculi]|uniref:Uncharacterized protein n=1 Tax=Mangrovivirga cuniculi TaxID=2715131 RepID=A0A4D7JTK9_9BACT|nr:hypothetical protein [Mangrovivirga cuniculi]QCK15476.1 hypothetical protein DCC35_12340 [Mangrovivirga cuniculi]
MKKILILQFIFTILIGCVNKKTNANEDKNNNISKERLFYYPDDIRTKSTFNLARRYKSYEDSLINKKGYSSKKAEEIIQGFIDDGLILEPEITYFSDEGIETISLKYTEFKYYYKILNDSIGDKVNDSDYLQY